MPVEKFVTLGAVVHVLASVVGMGTLFVNAYVAKRRRAMSWVHAVRSTLTSSASLSAALAAYVICNIVLFASGAVVIHSIWRDPECVPTKHCVHHVDVIRLSSAWLIRTWVLGISVTVAVCYVMASLALSSLPIAKSALKSVSTWAFQS